MPKGADFKAIDTMLDLIKAGFAPLERAQPRHFAAIGRFLTAMSNNVDIPLSQWLQTQIDATEDGITRIIVGNLPVGDVMAAIRRIATLRQPGSPIVDDINVLFNEIGALREHRNHIAHNTGLFHKNRFAFHNALIAKTESSVDVAYYTIKEIDELTAYSKRIHHRISTLNARMTPEYIHPKKQILIAHLALNIQMNIAVAMLKSNKLTEESRDKLKALVGVAHTTVNRYAELTDLIDPDFTSAKTEAGVAIRDLAAFIGLWNAPSGEALHEIPRRLQKKDRVRQRDAPQARRRRPRP